MRRVIDRVFQRLRSIFQGAAVDRALQREIEDHLAEQIAENMAAGMTPTDARRAALRAFGPSAVVAEQCRDTRRVSVIQNIVRDLRYTLRSLSHQPLLVVAATLSIGAATAATGIVFTLVGELLLSPPTARQADRLIYIRLANGSHVSYQQWRALDQSRALDGLAGYQVEAEVNWAGPERSMSIMPLLVTANFFDVTGVPVAIGRPFTASEAAAESGPDVVVISHRFWRNRLGGEAGALGRVLVFNGQPYTVVGILPESLRAIPGFGIAPEVYLPISRALLSDLDNRQASAVELIGRLRDSQTLEQGRAAFQAAVEHHDAVVGARDLRHVDKFAAAEGLGFSFGEIGMFFTVLAVAVGLVLAIACANVAGLLLSRASVRRREVGVRAALGASRARLVQQFLIEAFWIGLFGTVAGLTVSHVVMLGLSRVHLPLPIPLELHPALDLRMVMLSLLLVALTTVMCGLMPALQATGNTLLPALKQDEPRLAGRRLTIRRLLVIGQVAVALVLLLTAFLFLRNLALARELDPGFDIAHTLVAQVSFVEGRHTPAARAALLDDAVERLRALSGVVSASYSHGVPLMMRSGMTTGAELRRGDRPDPFLERYHANFVGPGYFSTLGISLIAGREFTPADRPGNTAVAIINAEFARRHFLDESPIGKHLLLPGAGASYPAEIVGVVGNGKYRSIGEEQQPAVYEPYVQRGNRGRFLHVLVRTRETAEHAKADVERVLSTIDPTAAIEAVPMRSALAFAFLPSQVGAALVGGLGAVGVILAMVGLYATIAYSVSRRTAEIGLRIAVGASEGAVMRMVLGDAALVAGIGIAIGVGAAAFVTQPLGAFLVAGLSAADPLTFTGTTVLLFVVSLAASAIPARRAMRIDPVAALRRE